MSDVVNLDEKRTGRDATHAFLFGGEKFTARVHVRPDIRAEWEAGREGENSVEALAATDKMILAFLVPDDRDRYTKLRDRDDSPVTLDDVWMLVKHLFEVAGGRPTKVSSPSSSGDTKEEDSSTAASSSTEATPKA